MSRNPGAQWFRFAVDMGGTFTDLVVESGEGFRRFFKRPTTPDGVTGLLDAVGAAAMELRTTSRDLLSQGTLLVHGTTRATNAIVTGETARTAFLTTQGHPDVLLFREGAERVPPYDYTLVYPDPYVPRALTFEVPERIRADGEVKVLLDEPAVTAILRRIRALDVQAVGVCLLWSIVNPVHELRIGELLEEHLPGLPYTLSHKLNATLREYRRASSTVIDASLKPLMTRYIDDLDQRLRDEGFTGRLLMLTSAGGVQDARHVAQAPIHTIGSGPAAAPVAGRQFAMRDAKAETAIVTDAGGTTFDVSLIRGGHIPWTRETMVGHPKLGYLTGFPSIDVRSIGAGGGSIAWVDEGGLLHVGPESAGAVPGPACYGRGGMRPTVTDACVVLGYIDPDFFLGGAMPLAAQLASDAIEQQIGQPLGLGLFEAASATLDLACERMVNAIEEITLLQGVDPRQAVVVAGGGGAGLYAVTIARRLKAESVVIPNVAAALSATGALLSDLKSEYAKAAFTTTAAFDYSLVNATLSELKDLCRGFLAGPASDVDGASTIHFAVEARYADQVWEIEVPLKVVSFDGEDDVKQLERDFHHAHEQLFAVRDAASTIEIVSWRARVSAQLRDDEWRHEDLRADGSRGPRTRSAYFSGVGLVETDVRRTEQLRHREILTGPAVIESEAQTVVVPPGSTVELLPSGSLLLHPLEVTGSTLTPGSLEGVSA